MELDRKSRRQLRLQSATFTVLFLAAVGLLAFLSTRYHYQADWTAAGRHTLSEASGKLLATLGGPVQITAYARDTDVSGLRDRIRDLVERYQRSKPDLQLTFVDPDREPDRVKQAGVVSDGELVVSYQGRSEHVRALDEASLTNALERLARGGERKIIFLTGNGERRPDGQANHDYGEWGRELKAKGLTVVSLNLAAEAAIPDETSVLVVADPQTPVLGVNLITSYLERGGNLLWLSDTTVNESLAPLAAALGLGRVPGVIVDPTTQLLGIPQPDFTVVGDYPPHPVTEGLGSLTLFPRAVALKLQGEGWEPEPLLVSVPRSWSETGPLQGTIEWNEGKEQQGPLVLAYALTRDRPGAQPLENGAPPPQQRVVVAGDADFLANAYLGNGANLELGNRLLNWLAHDDRLIQIPPKTAPDTRLELSDPYRVAVSLLFLLLLPLSLVAAGVAIWLRRRKR